MKKLSLAKSKKLFSVIQAQKLVTYFTQQICTEYLGRYLESHGFYPFKLILDRMYLSIRTLHIPRRGLPRVQQMAG